VSVKTGVTTLGVTLVLTTNTIKALGTWERITPSSNFETTSRSIQQA